MTSTRLSDLTNQGRPWRLVVMILGLLLLLALGTAASPAMAEAWQEGDGTTVPVATPPPPASGQPGQPVLHPLGIGLAILFVVLMVSMFRWMFRVPPQLPYAVVKARQSVSALRRILVPTTEDVASERAVELACRLGEMQKAEIVLAYILEVPFTLSLDAPMPTEEARGQQALRTALFIVEQHGLPAKTRLIPHRYTWSGILRLATEEMADAIVMSVGAGRPGQAEGVGHTAQEVLKRAECEVILDKRPAWTVPTGA